ncbi:MAG TPA: ubiquinol-cytochrome c reductase iron-sulfur subunit [Chloroflexota bacterium]|nr:ubiquinol-cytochrome c reductase iron-sulfur subunit [Chloroflexota bacterium]
MPKHLIRLHGLGEIGSRRRFLANVTFGFSGLIGALIGIPLVGYIFGPLIKQAPNTWETLGKVDDFQVGDTKLVSFTDSSSVPWAGQASQTSVWVRRKAPDQFDVFAVNCTHLGCPVNWIQSARLFECPCHGGIYYASGDVAAGPPPRALYRHQVRIQNGEVQALTFPIPTSG